MSQFKDDLERAIADIARRHNVDHVALDAAVKAAVQPVIDAQTALQTRVDETQTILSDLVAAVKVGGDTEEAVAAADAHLGVQTDVSAPSPAPSQEPVSNLPQANDPNQGAGLASDTPPETVPDDTAEAGDSSPAESDQPPVDQSPVETDNGGDSSS